ncbi:hypothetical protein BDBG_17420 [Blastomyces gilchristii SLH14081]|uniref:Uncharacterized protein n=1 Tax=Blastomyces gilchristii (strain SLH14081) TaxID=559298 RepID=A0A179UUU0_BLAGS|nr:uncharacterized protein BDBG_17420 [Blastomyces gilchristii SLH14081]OAT10811.1 hypothetical protein BDBG_17420 [Blastomyces gilchristii SLH14081]
MLGRTALHIATIKGYTDCVQLILNRVPPAVIHCLDYELLAPLSKAAELGHVEIVNLLLQQAMYIPIHEILETSRRCNMLLPKAITMLWTCYKFGPRKPPSRMGIKSSWQCKCRLDG